MLASLKEDRLMLSVVVMKQVSATWVFGHGQHAARPIEVDLMTSDERENLKKNASCDSSQLPYSMTG